MCIARNFVSASAGQKIKVGASICLFHVVHVHLCVTACWSRLGCPPLFAFSECLFPNDKRQSPGWNIKLNDVSVLDERKCSANSRFRGHVEHDGSICGATHASIRDS